jgi:peptidoglycan/LPS O-acetylase OafA/YrhL
MSARPQEGRLQPYRRDAQGLRAIAIIMVVLWHTGILNIHDGVVVSFVLSGYLIGRQLFREIGETGKVSLGKFWARRMRRLVPGMAIVVTVTIVFSWLFASPLRFRGYVSDGFSSAFSLLNWKLAENGTDYFANNGTQTPYQHFWSLSIEEQFYLVAPLLLVAVAWLSRKLFKNRALVVAALVSIIAGSFCLSIIQTQSDQPLAYFGTHTRAWELAVGLLLALGAEWLSRMNLAVAAIMTWVGLVLMIGTGMLITDHTALPGYADAGPVLGAAMVLAGGCANPRFGAEWLLKRKPFDVIANVSYGWYLWHWPLLILWPNIFGHEITYSDRFRIAFFSFLMASAMHYAIEKKIRANKAFIVVPRRGIVLGGSLTTATAAFMGIALIVPLNLAPATTTTAAPTTSVVGLDSVKQAAFQKDLPGNVQPALVDAPKDIANFGCIDQLEDKTFTLRSGCVIGDLKAERTIVVLGDSHAWQWGDAFNELGIRLKVKVVTITKSGCSAEDYNIRNDQLGRSYSECSEWRTSALSTIEKLHPEVIVVTSRSRREATKEGAETTFAQLQALGSKLIYMTDTPHPGVNIPDCLVLHTNDVAACNRPATDVVEFPEQRAMEREVAVAHGAVVMDVLPAFCTSATCPPVIGDRITYFDDSHVTASYALALAPFLEPALRVALS